MTTKRSSSKKKSPVKKVKAKAKSVVKKASGSAKKAIKKTTKTSTVRKRASSRRSNKENKPKETHFSAPAFGLIDQAAGFLRRAVSEADNATAYERRAIRENALSFVDSASKRLMQALDDDSSPARKNR